MESVCTIFTYIRRKCLVGKNINIQKIPNNNPKVKFLEDAVKDIVKKKLQKQVHLRMEGQKYCWEYSQEIKITLQIYSIRCQSPNHYIFLK